MKNNDTFLSLISGFLIAYMLIGNMNNTIQEKTLYQQYCAGFKHNVFHCPENLILAKTEFKIFIDKQTVVANTLIPSVYKNCNVFDKDNWHCKEDEGRFISMQNGEFFETNDGSIGADEKHSNLPRGNQIPGFFYYIFSARDFFLKFGKIITG